MIPKKAPAHLVLIRHGESLRNSIKANRTYFQNDAERQPVRGIPDHDMQITDVGLQQARATSTVLRQMFGTPDRLYHSGYARTVSTTDGILSTYPQDERQRISVRQDTHIRERDPGYAYDMTEAESHTAFPWLKEHWKTFGGFMARPPGGESLCDMTARLSVFLDTLRRDCHDMTVFLVTHGGTIRVLRFLLENQTIAEATTLQGPSNCGVTIYDRDCGSGELLLREHDEVLW